MSQLLLVIRTAVTDLLINECWNRDFCRERSHVWEVYTWITKDGRK